MRWLCTSWYKTKKRCRDVKGFSERAEEVRNEFGTTVRSDVRRHTMFGEDMHNKELSKTSGSDSGVCRNEDGLLSETVNDYKYRVGTVGKRKSFDEIHRDRVPRTIRDGKLFQCSIRAMTLRFRTHTRSTGFAVFLNKGAETRPSILMTSL